MPMQWIAAALLLVFAGTWLRTHNVRRALSVTLAVLGVCTVILLGVSVYAIMRH